jgi:hypothetical protein
VKEFVKLVLFEDDRRSKVVGIAAGITDVMRASGADVQRADEDDFGDISRSSGR